MAQKIRKIEEFLALSVETPKVVSYADYFMRSPLFLSLQIKNSGTIAIENLTLSITNENGLLAPCVKQIEEIPFESKIEVDAPNALSPLYFVNLEEVKEEEIFIELCKDKSGKVNWKQVWEHTTTVLLILVLASPLFILAYIMGWFFTRQQL